MFQNTQGLQGSAQPLTPILSAAQEKRWAFPKSPGELLWLHLKERDWAKQLGKDTQDLQHHLDPSTTAGSAHPLPQFMHKNLKFKQDNFWLWRHCSYFLLTFLHIILWHSVSDPHSGRQNGSMCNFRKRKGCGFQSSLCTLGWIRWDQWCIFSRLLKLFYCVFLTVGSMYQWPDSQAFPKCSWNAFQLYFYSSLQVKAPWGILQY